MRKPDLSRRGLSPAPADYAAAGDLLRVFCIFMIGWYHIWQQSWLAPVLTVGGFTLNLYPYVRAGYMFVDLMLMLSGFLLYLPYANGTERSPGAFYLRRALRILPSYWLCLAVMLAWTLAQNGAVNAGQLAKDLIAHLTFTHNLFGFSHAQTQLNAALWTLAVEVQFYLLLPALAPAFRRQPLVCYLAMVGAALSFRFLWTAKIGDTTMFVNRLPNMLDVYANGMLAAHLYARMARWKRRRGWVAALGTALFVAGSWGVLRVVCRQAMLSGFDVMRRGQLDVRWPLSAFGALALLGGSLSFGPVRRLCSNRLVRFLSAISFNFYMWHQWLAVRLKLWRIPPYLSESDPNQVREMPWQLHYTLLCFAAALALATLLTYAIEKPAARAGMKRLKRK